MLSLTGPIAFFGTQSAQGLAMVESVTGQFYVAILIARLVSIRYSKGGDDYD